MIATGPDGRKWTGLVSGIVLAASTAACGTDDAGGIGAAARSGDGFVEVGSLSARVDGEPHRWSILAAAHEPDGSSADWTDLGGGRMEVILQGYEGGSLTDRQLQLGFYLRRNDAHVRIEVSEGEGQATLSLLDPSESPYQLYQLWEGTVEVTRIDWGIEGPALVEGVFHGTLGGYQSGRVQPEDTIRIEDGRFRATRLQRNEY